MQSDRTLEEAKAAIAQGDLGKLKELLERSHEEEVEREILVHPSELSSYGNRTDDELIPVMRMMREDIKDINLEKDGADLLIHAALTRQEDIVKFLLNMGVKITPTVMKTFLDELAANIKPILLETGLNAEPLNYELQPIHLMVNRITLLIFKDFLDNSLHKDKVILEMVKRFERYLLPGRHKEEMMKEFHEYAQKRIFLNGSADLIQQTENIYHFKDYFLQHPAGDDPKRIQGNIAGVTDTKKLVLLNLFRFDEVDAAAIRENYQNTIQLALARLTQIHSAERERVTKPRLFAINRKPFVIIDKAFNEIIDVCIDTKTNEVEKVTKMLGIIHIAHQQLKGGKTSISSELEELYQNALKQINISGKISFPPSVYIELLVHNQLMEIFPKKLEQDIAAGHLTGPQKSGPG